MCLCKAPFSGGRPMLRLVDFRPGKPAHKAWELQFDALKRGDQESEINNVCKLQAVRPSVADIRPERDDIGLLWRITNDLGMLRCDYWTDSCSWADSCRWFVWIAHGSTRNCRKTTAINFFIFIFKNINAFWARNKLKQFDFRSEAKNSSDPAGSTSR